MARILKKIPNFKFPRKKIKELVNVDGVKVDYTEADYKKIRKTLENKGTKHDLYPGTSYKTIKEMFHLSTSKYSDKAFILEVFNKKNGYEEITYGQFRKDVINFGTGLMRALALENEPVIIIGETTYHWYVSYLALLCGAGIAVPVDRELPENELENLVRRSKAKAIIYSPKEKDVVKKVSLKCSGIKFCIEMKSDGDPHKIIRDGKKYEREKGESEFLKVGFDFVSSEGEVFVHLGDHSLMEKEIDPEAFAVLIFTSGTTSEAKGVMISNHNLAANINGITPFVKLNPEDRLLSVLPLHHTYESTIGFLYPMSVGASIAVCQGLKHIAANMQNTKPTAIIAVPLLIEAIYKKINATIKKSGKDYQVHSLMKITSSMRNLGVDVRKKVFKGIHQSLGGNLRIIVSAAAPIDIKVGKWFEDIGLLFLQGYGLTETAPIAALTPDFEPRVGSAGKSVIVDEIKIKNPNEKGEGEILIKGETVMLGYYDDLEKTKETIVDGWFHSGDIGYLDQEGFLYITGRSKNVIVTQNGKNIYPEEVEGLLNKIEEISEVMVYGKKIELEKELVVTARVIPNYDKILELHGENGKTAFTEDEIKRIIWEEIKKVNRQLNNYKCIKKLEIKKDEFEKTSTMKIKRYAELKKGEM